MNQVKMLAIRTTAQLIWASRRWFLIYHIIPTTFNGKIHIKTDIKRANVHTINTLYIDKYGCWCLWCVYSSSSFMFLYFIYLLILFCNALTIPIMYSDKKYTINAFSHRWYCVCAIVLAKSGFRFYGRNIQKSQHCHHQSLTS